MDTQDSIYLSIETPLGKDVLLARSSMARSASRAPFRFDLELHSRPATWTSRRWWARAPP